MALMMRMEITSEECRVIGEALINNNSLESLNIANNGLEKPGAQVFAKVLMKNEGLQVLDLSLNQLSSEAILLLVEPLKHNNTLRKLILRDTPMSMDVVRSVIVCNFTYARELRALERRKPSLSINFFNLAEKLEIEKQVCRKILQLIITRDRNKRYFQRKLKSERIEN